jgi:NAD(P)-dependent dehydrogenase (short-subunit alcohol dehydrogenase family)
MRRRGGGGAGTLGRRDFLAVVAGAAAAAGCRPEEHTVQGKICLVTGATSGMGAVTALELARRGATVVVAGRSAARCRERVEAIRQATGARAEVAVADLASLSEVRALAADVAQRFPRLDVLVNNAGTYQFDRVLTADGLEKTFAVNYLSHFLLTNLLLGRLRASPAARVVNVSSSAHHGARLEWDNLQGERSFERLDAYARSKLALLLFTYELSRRLHGTQVTANAVHPGVVATNLGSDNGLVRGWLRTQLRNRLDRSMISPEEGARWIVQAAAAPELAGVTGAYFAEGRLERSSPESYDEATAARLWTVSEALAGL